MKTWLKILILLFILLVIAVFCVYYFVINKPHPDYDKEPAKYELAAADLFNQFNTDRKASETKYNGQVIAITGKFKNVELADTLSIIVFSFREGTFGDEGIRCTLLPKYNSMAGELSKDSDVTIKGYCSGYNDTDIIMIKCSII